MSKDKALRYIDSIQGYLHPRMVASLNLDTMHINIGIADMSVGSTVNIFPNPALTSFTLKLDNPAEKMQYITFSDLTGRVMMEISGINADQVEISRGHLTAGVYMVKIGLKEKELNRKLIFQ